MRYFLLVCLIGLGLSLITFGLVTPGDRDAYLEPQPPRPRSSSTLKATFALSGPLHASWCGVSWKSSSTRTASDSSTRPRASPRSHSRSGSIGRRTSGASVAARVAE